MKLNTNYSENNYLELVGKITSEKVFSHEIYGESFYIFNLEVPRLSGTADSIPITISERLISNFDLSIGKKVEIEGQFRSYNTYENQRSRLVLTVFAKEIKFAEDMLICKNQQEFCVFVKFAILFFHVKRLKTCIY